MSIERTERIFSFPRSIVIQQCCVRSLLSRRRMFKTWKRWISSHKSATHSVHHRRWLGDQMKVLLNRVKNFFFSTLISTQSKTHNSSMSQPFGILSQVQKSFISSLSIFSIFNKEWENLTDLLFAADKWYFKPVWCVRVIQVMHFNLASDGDESEYLTPPIDDSDSCSTSSSSINHWMTAWLAAAVQSLTFGRRAIEWRSCGALDAMSVSRYDRRVTTLTY